MRKIGFLRLGGLLVFIIAVWIAFAASAGAASMDAVWPECPGIDVQSNGKLVIDASNMSKGYVMARISKESKHGFKMRVSCGKVQLNYDLNSEGGYEVFPLQMGSGKYEFSLFENVKGSKYSAEGKLNLSVNLDDENAAYLVPNQYVNYQLWTSAVQKSDELCADATPAEAYDAVTKFISSEFVYDFARAKKVAPGQLPDIDYCYDNRMGICQDLSALMVCMLRVQGVPAKLVIGYADKYYHAWTNVVVDGKEVFFDPTVAVGALKAKKYQIERMY